MLTNGATDECCDVSELFYSCQAHFWDPAITSFFFFLGLHALWSGGLHHQCHSKSVRALPSQRSVMQEYMIRSVKPNGEAELSALTSHLVRE